MLQSLVRLQGKDVRFGEEARRLIQKGVSRAVAAVATTLGPKGRNVIIEQAYGSPKITKDGVTVAKAIEFKDPFENMGAQLVRQVCNKTNDLAGDGTTTSAVLVDSIFSEGMKHISRGTNPIDMKRGMDKAVEKILENKDTSVGYDVLNDRYVNMFEAGIVDSTRVVRVAITDATSVASIRMTAEAAIVDLPKKEKYQYYSRRNYSGYDSEDKWYRPSFFKLTILWATIVGIVLADKFEEFLEKQKIL